MEDPVPQGNAFHFGETMTVTESFLLLLHLHLSAAIWGDRYIDLASVDYKWPDKQRHCVCMCVCVCVCVCVVCLGGGVMWGGQQGPKNCVWPCDSIQSWADLEK